MQIKRILCRPIWSPLLLILAVFIIFFSTASFVSSLTNKEAQSILTKLGGTGNLTISVRDVESLSLINAGTLCVISPEFAKVTCDIEVLSLNTWKESWSFLFCFMNFITMCRQ